MKRKTFVEAEGTLGIRKKQEETSKAFPLWSHFWLEYFSGNKTLSNGFNSFITK